MTRTWAEEEHEWLDGNFAMNGYTNEDLQSPELQFACKDHRLDQADGIAGVCSNTVGVVDEPTPN